MITVKSSQLSIKIILLSGLLILFLALGVRFLTWQEQRFDAWKTQENVAKSYRLQAAFIREDGLLSLLDVNARASNVDFMLHPPGYPIVLAAAFALFGKSDATIQWLSIIADSLSAVVIFLIAAELLSLNIALTTGLLAAFSPQFAANSILLLPDVLAILPLLIAFYFLIKATREPRYWKFLFCGVCVGLSCWIRANALLLPIFLAIAAIYLLPAKRFTSGATIILGAVLMIAPIAIRNYAVFKTLIPLSLGTGQTLLEGIGDYDFDKRYGMPKYDWDVTRQEAEMFNRPDYANNLVTVDGIARDRQRTARGLQFIGEHPVWFGGVMIRRALWMLTPEKTQNVTINIPVSRPIDSTENAEQILTQSPTNLAANGSLVSNRAAISLNSPPDNIILQTDEQKYGIQFASPAFAVKSGTEYALRLRYVLRRGRIRIAVRNAGETVLASGVIDPDPAAEQPPAGTILVPFVSGGNAVKFTVANEAPQTATSTLEIQKAELVELGAARNAWTLPFRYFVSYLQKIFTLPVLLSLELIGLGILGWRRDWKIILTVMTIPLYYFCVQSILHTEYRYVLIIHHFLFILAATAMIVISSWLINKIARLRSRAIKNN